MPAQGAEDESVSCTEHDSFINSPKGQGTSQNREQIKRVRRKRVRKNDTMLFSRYNIPIATMN